MSAPENPHSINEFLSRFDTREALSGQLGQQCAAASQRYLGDDLLQPMKLCDATIDYLAAAMAEGHKFKGKQPVLKMQLFAVYRQSADVSTALIMEGSYIKAAATLKQDYEIIVSLNEINNGRYKHGKTPHAQNGPPSFKEMNGYLNEIAHISKEDVLFDLLQHTEKGLFKGISSVKRLNKKAAIKLMTYNIAIKTELCRQALNFYLEIAGQDQKHGQAWQYYQLINERLAAIGLFE
ncbi:hypothetical protein SAMN05428975_0314 [Mucilaginibacter sp. OK268]|uniref:hypothetical protein n=1 Tax=Mucilaginibacter sp. OK268 TaxID=1881048 RepID=UPI0008826690|nr:hypothetical protein [Mucilaginibacter sp. OK268]SDP10331.1 hypothetical protein SAMN05428975_0314 [Mucilaginibacter sp. OK268]